MEVGKENKDKNRGATRHCCFGLCNSDSRYKEREHMQGVSWIAFPKPHRDLEKCKRWIHACGRKTFTHENVNKWTYICSKHFVNSKGPTEQHPDPVPASFTPMQVSKMSRKRKPPTPRTNPVSKRQLFDAAEALLTLHDTDMPDCDGNISAEHVDNQAIPETLDAATSTDTDTASKETQTSFLCNDILASKINRIIVKNSDKKGKKEKSRENFCYENISKDARKFHFYTGLTVLQFMHLFSSFGSEPENLNYWRGSKTKESASKKTPERKVSPINQLFMTSVKLRQAFPNQDIAYRFGVSVSTVSNIVNTWIQYLYKKTGGLRKRMFPPRHLIKRHLPACFSSFKNVRVIIDCFEMSVQSPRNFAEQGNMYSSYKNNTTLKCLVGISPTGAISFLSDTYEGSISDRDLFIKSQMANQLLPGDLVIADRGFLIKDVLQQYQVELNIPPFLNGRTKLTPQEEIVTKRIARVRIHVERAIERMKKYKILSKRLPLSLKPVVSQIVHVIGLLVNYEAPIVK